MIEKIKYCLSKFFSCRQMRIGCIAVMIAITIAAGTLLSNSVYTVNIFDGESTYTVRTLNRNVNSVLSGMEFKSDNYDIETTTVAGRTTLIEIAYTYPVYITCADQTTEISFTGGTVAEALKKAGIEVDEHDFVEPNLETQITDTVYIDYTDIDYVNGSYTENIPFATETVYSNNAPKGEVKTLSAGSNGVKEVYYTEKLVNGVSVEKNVTGTAVITEAINAKQQVGTKLNAPTAVKTSAEVKSISVLTPAKAIELDANGNPISFKSKMTVRATAYTYTGNNCATGVAPAPGYIAVNPKVIPYGTKLYIKSPDGSVVYGYAVAADTGGFIRKHPTGVDLFMATRSACVSFGVRNMEIYILE